MARRLLTEDSIGLLPAARAASMFNFSDPFGIAAFIGGVFRDMDEVFEGHVLTYHPGTHSAAVRIYGLQNHSVWSCVFADEALSYAYGYSETHPPCEGEAVLVARAGAACDAGIVIGRLPYPLRFMGQDVNNDPDQYHRRLFTQNKDTWDKDLSVFSDPLLNKSDASTTPATHFRPTDVYPGEFAHVNQHNCGVKGGMFSAALLGGGASLRLSAIANAARLTCANYIRHSLHGTVHEFHNGRYLSSERNYALYQEERLGGDAPQAEVWTEDSEEPKGGELQTMRPRMKDLTGFFGHLSSRFCFRPDPDEGSDPRVLGDVAPREAGVSRETIDPSGQYRLSAAGMIAIERTGRIPVPVRNSFPTDDDHQIESDPEKLEPFKHDDSDPGYRQLELFDRQAYDLRNQYARVDGLGTDYPDYDVPQEDELKPLKDEYDEKFGGNKTVELEKYDKRRAGVFIGEDGSVIIRDAWGSEVVMLGGNVSISCAGNVMLMPGRTALTIAGDDIVQKAQNSVDIHASEHDVRLSAARNMEILGGADESSHQGGVVIESRGKSMSPWDGEDKGEQAQARGVTIRSEGQGVVVDGPKVVIRSRERTSIVSGGKSVDGSVDIAAKTLSARAQTVTATTGKAAVALSSGGANVIGKNVNVCGESVANVLKGSQALVPLKWQDIGTNVASELIPSYDKQTERLDDEKQASGGFGSEELGKMKFGFRTSQECGTDKPWVIGANGDFKLYEPAWAQVKDVYETLKEGGVQADSYKEDGKWDNGRPWPGKDAEESGKFAKLGGGPRNLTEDGFNKSRKEVKDHSDITEDMLSGYVVRKTP